jgi:hypothetical protein
VIPEWLRFGSSLSDDLTSCPVIVDCASVASLMIFKRSLCLSSLTTLRYRYYLSKVSFANLLGRLLHGFIADYLVVLLLLVFCVRDGGFGSGGNPGGIGGNFSGLAYSVGENNAVRFCCITCSILSPTSEGTAVSA